MRREQIQRPGAFYHVILRGNTSEPIFYTENDRCKLSLLLQKWVERFGHEIHGFCFMTTHIHLIVKTGDCLLWQSLDPLSTSYYRHQNKTERLRFKSILIANQIYLLELVRYIHLNPVTAGIVTNPEHYLWSSHRAYLGLDLISWLTRDFILQTFIRPGADPVYRYENFITKRNWCQAWHCGI